MTDQPTNPPAVGYVRVSTEEQATHGVSLAAQRAAIREYCARHGLNLLRLYTDEGVSAGKPLAKRRSGGALYRWTATEEAKGGHLVVTDLDRAFRNVRDALEVAAALRDRGVHLHLIREQLDTTTAMGWFTLTFQTALAELERNRCAERTKRASEHVRETGGTAGYLEYGERLYCSDTCGHYRYSRVMPKNRRCEKCRAKVTRGPCPRELATLGRIWELRHPDSDAEAAPMPRGDTAQVLNAEGREPKRGECWTASAVRNQEARLEADEELLDRAQAARRVEQGRRV